MTLNVDQEMAALRRLTMRELRARFAAVFGETTPAGNRLWLMRRILWRLQALAEGDLSERGRRRAAERRRPTHPAAPVANTQPRLERERCNAARDGAHARVQGADAAGAGPGQGLRIRGRDLSIAQRRGAGHH